MGVHPRRTHIFGALSDYATYYSKPFKCARRARLLESQTASDGPRGQFVQLRQGVSCHFAASVASPSIGSIFSNNAPGIPCRCGKYAGRVQENQLFPSPFSRASISCGKSSSVWRSVHERSSYFGVAEGQDLGRLHLMPRHAVSPL